METRRSFLIKGVAGCLAIMLPVGTAGCAPVKSSPGIKTLTPRRALVTWYSQTGHTRRIGKVIGSEWIRAGLAVDLADYRDINPAMLAGYDLIALGTPVYYMDVPVNLRLWIRDLPALEGIPAAAYVTYGGHGDGQHHTACGLLEELAGKGAVPAGMDMFGNMSTFAPTWSMGNAKRILKYKDRPNERTYDRARRFAARTLDNVRAGRNTEIEGEFGLDAISRLLPQVWFTRLLIGRHYIDKDACIECGLCQDNCPSDAIDLSGKTIDRDRCLVCIGCVNNCPAGAVKMTFMGSDVYGFQEFLKRNNITIIEPQL
jgi:ferredoxin/flavodoxin